MQFCELRPGTYPSLCTCISLKNVIKRLNIRIFDDIYLFHRKSPMLKISTCTVIPGGQYAEAEKMFVVRIFYYVSDTVVR